MAQLTAHHIEPDAGGEGELGVGVAGAVERDRRHVSSGDEPVPPCSERGRVDDPAVGLRHDPLCLRAEPAVELPGRTELQTLGSLGRLPRPQHLPPVFQRTPRQTIGGGPPDAGSGSLARRSPTTRVVREPM